MEGSSEKRPPQPSQVCSHTEKREKPGQERTNARSISGAGQRATVPEVSGKALDKKTKQIDWLSELKTLIGVRRQWPRRQRWKGQALISPSSRNHGNVQNESSKQAAMCVCVRVCLSVSALVSFCKPDEINVRSHLSDGRDSPDTRETPAEKPLCYSQLRSSTIDG